MMHVLPCVQVREDLAAYHDGELPLEQQVLVQSHIKECVACRLEAGELADLGDALRTMASAIPGRAQDDAGRLTSAVLERIRVEEQLSFSAQFRNLFDDMHLVWAGLGATTAMLFCIFASAGVLQAASQERPDSLAGIISTIATNDNAMRLASATFENSVLLDTTEAIQATDQMDAELMLSAMVTRDGRIQNVEVLAAQQAEALHVKPEIVLAMLDAASRARFEPTPPGGWQAPINVVWLVTSTTVKGRADYDLYLLSPPKWTGPVHGPALPPKPRPAPTPTPAKVPTAGNDGVAAA